MKVLVACEFSGIVRDAFAAKGHQAFSVDIIKSEREGSHYVGDIRSLGFDRAEIDLMIAHPPCTYLSSSGLHWNCRTPGRAAKTWDAIQFAEFLWNVPVPKIALENPQGCLSTFSSLMKPTQVIQPYEYGDDASKATCLWLKGLPPLQPTQFVSPRIVDGKERWANQTDSGQNKLAPSEHRAADRSRTYEGIARAMAEQWG